MEKKKDPASKSGKISRVKRLRLLRESFDFLLNEVRAIKSPEDRLGHYLKLIDKDN